MKRVDLRKDATDLLRYLTERVRAFDPGTNDGPGRGKSVTRVDVGYQCDQAGWVAVVFDTRPRAKPDGSWNSHIEGNTLERPKWLAAFEANEEQPLRFVLPDGSTRDVAAGEYEEVVTVFGELLKAVLLEARDDGVFAGLPRSAKCELGVEEHDGQYGWPAYEERGRENLVGAG